MNATPFSGIDGGDHAVLLLHGLSSSPLELRFLARLLADEGFATHTPELPGYSAGTGHQPMEQWISAAVAEFDRLAARHRHVSICGLSMGATLAAAVAHERPAARALLLLSITLNYDGWAIPWYRFLLDYVYYTPLRSRYRYREQEPYGLRNEALRSKIARAMQKNDISEVGPAFIGLPALHEAGRLAGSVKKKLKGIGTDCLIIHAIDDETSSPHNARFVGTTIGAVMPKPAQLPVSMWTYYIGVDDIDRALDAIKAGGGQVLNGPMEIPGGEFAVNAMDPQGASFGLVGPRK